MENDSAILSVTQLNRQIKMALEEGWDEIVVEGEISNLTKPASGHWYFTLKDNTAQIRCVFFRPYHTSKSLQCKEGQQVIVKGKLSLYEARGDYQLIVQTLDLAGMGLLYQQFLQLKNKLEGLGLFSAQRKKPLPLFPHTIAVITSNTGAAIRDILSTLARRYPLACVHIYPCEVQGKNAANQLIQALSAVNSRQEAEVIILARGGGSIEDLWSFNDERLAYAISNSIIPVVSGVGHETDFTIADFVADFRAATPTAAAEAVSPDKAHLLEQLSRYINRMACAINKLVAYKMLLLSHHKRFLASPNQLVSKSWQSLDYLEQQLHQLAQQRIYSTRLQLEKLCFRLENKNPALLITQTRILLQSHIKRLHELVQHRFTELKQQFQSVSAVLHLVSPLATLDRGYAIATHNGSILFNSTAVKKNDIISLRLAKGELICHVDRILS